MVIIVKRGCMFHSSSDGFEWVDLCLLSQHGRMRGIDNGGNRPQEKKTNVGDGGKGSGG